MSDIGVGDVMEHFQEPDPRRIVRKMLFACRSVEIKCPECGSIEFAFWLFGIDDMPCCPNHWRKIGPGRSETVSRFAHHLAGAKVKERA